MNILWGFNIEMACDKKGKKMFPDMDNYVRLPYPSPSSKHTLYAGFYQHSKGFPMLDSAKKWSTRGRSLSGVPKYRRVICII